MNISSETIAQIDQLLDRIKYGDCVLFLGPDILVDNRGMPLSVSYSHDICNRMQKANIDFDTTQQNDIYYSTNRYISGLNKLQSNNYVKTTDLTIKREYNKFINDKASYTNLHKHLSKMPFYLTINTNPDDLIFKLIKEDIGTNQKCHFGYYDITKDNNEGRAEKDLPAEINTENYVVYNVYGHASDNTASSVIIRESEFLDLSRKINTTGNAMPDVIKTFIKNNKICLFLGFQYDSWPLKILLRSLGFTQDVPGQNISFTYNGLLKHHADFYKDNLQFVFIDSEPSSFVTFLYERMQENISPDDILKKIPDKPLNIVFISDLSDTEDSKIDTQIRDHIANTLQPLRYNGFISMWSEDLPTGGTDKQAELTRRYNEADMFIVVGTANLFAADYFSRIENALALTHEGNKMLIPVYARDFLYNDISGITNNSWIPRENNKPVPVKEDLDRRGLAACEVIKTHITTILKAREANAGKN
ncbi:SIR2 family protein [Filimonas effusa]|uniref:Uncharacterized protein n=1 Tax=Filimonas effusa TaxID=2508721 RepID=A0A4Q1DAF0_9BACT|nr:SIR2 family protein [Filimonas effusa]RXK86384.1 hypothetical protein ESB13_06150 [Filimonas effusa]